MATWYVRTDGSNSNTPTGNETPPIDGTIAFQTVQYAINSGGTGNASFANGDDVRICADADHVYDSTVTIDQANGETGLPITLIGATATGVVDGTRATLDFNLTSGNVDGISIGGTGTSFVNLLYLRITQAARYGVTSSPINSATYIHNCRIDTNGSIGAFPAGTGFQSMILDFCEVDGNSSHGIGTVFTGAPSASVYRCSVHDNGGNGINIGSRDASGAVVSNSLIYDNTGIGINFYYGMQIGGNLFYGHILNCVVDQNGSDGIAYFANGRQNDTMLMNTVISKNGGVGINTNNVDVKLFRFHNNWLWNNTGGRFDSTREFSDFPYAWNNVDDTDPLFTSDADGLENYEPQETSQMINAGVPGAMLAGGTGHMDVGALQRRMAAGGAGGLITHPGMTGGIRG